MTDKTKERRSSVQALMNKTAGVNQATDDAIREKSSEPRTPITMPGKLSALMNEQAEHEKKISNLKQRIEELESIVQKENNLGLHIKEEHTKPDVAHTRDELRLPIIIRLLGNGRYEILSEKL